MSYYGQSRLGSIHATINSRRYRRILDPGLRPFVAQDWIFQQDNDTAHVARDTDNYFSNQNISLLQWPANSSDLYPIENLWGILIRDVYMDNRQYNTVQDLMEEINRCWNNIDQNVVHNLYKSISKRISNVLKAQGCKDKVLKSNTP